jgi:hypothetical protein
MAYHPHENNRGSCFHSEKDCRRYLDTLKEPAEKHGCGVIPSCVESCLESTSWKIASSFMPNRSCMLKYWIFIAGFALTAQANAGWLIQDGIVEFVENTSGNSDVFTAFVSGGSGPCNSTLITFQKSSAANEDVYARAFTLLTAANVSGKKVSIYNYVDQSCGNAVGVRLVK